MDHATLSPERQAEILAKAANQEALKKQWVEIRRLKRQMNVISIECLYYDYVLKRRFHWFRNLTRTTNKHQNQKTDETKSETTKE